MRRLLGVIGDANDERTWSGIPSHLLRAARPRGFLQGGLALRPEALRRKRAWWNLKALLRTGRWGGFQYTQGFLTALLAQAEPFNGIELLSHFPLLAPDGVPVSYYIDATLRQNFEEYGIGARVSRSLILDTLERERRNYERAERIVCMSRWAADSVREAYGIPSAKIHVVRAGANLDEDRMSSLTYRGAPPGRSVLRLGFVGKDWQRKGLPLLLSVAEHIQATGQAVQVVVAGPKPGVLPRHRLLEPVGFLDKDRDLEQFVRVLSSCHFGCLLSKAEALGISTLEFLRLGVPVVGLAVGGIPDCISPQDGVLIPEGGSEELIAAALLEAWEPNHYAKLREGAQERATEVTWTRAVKQLEEIWG